MRQNKKVVIFNCPKRTGKDAVKDYILPLTFKEGFRTASFKEKLIEIALTVSNVTTDEWEARYEDFKDTPWQRLGGLSQREYLIHISENFVKPLHGEDYFGKALVDKIKSTQGKVFLIPDGGFDLEIKPLIDAFGEDNVLILQWTRHNADWEGDSRNWITSYPFITRHLSANDGKLEDHALSVLGMIHNHFGGQL